MKVCGLIRALWFPGTRDAGGCELSSIGANWTLVLWAIFLSFSPNLEASFLHILGVIAYGILNGRWVIILKCSTKIWKQQKFCWVFLHGLSMLCTLIWKVNFQCQIYCTETGWECCNLMHTSCEQIGIGASNWTYQFCHGKTCLIDLGSLSGFHWSKYGGQQLQLRITGFLTVSVFTVWSVKHWR